MTGGRTWTQVEARLHADPVYMPMALTHADAADLAFTHGNGEYSLRIPELLRLG